MRILYPGPSNPPGTKKPPTLRLDQVAAIYTLVREITDPAESGSALVGAGMGSGKTVVTVETMLRADKITPLNRVLIVGVRDSYSQWAQTLKEQGKATHALLRIDGTADGLKNLSALVNGDDGWYFAGLEMLRAQDWKKVSETWSIPKDIAREFGVKSSGTQERRAQLHTYAKMKPLDLLVSDEAHKHSNQKSDAIKTMNSIPTKKKIGLSGTFFGNKFENAWSLCVWLWGKSVIGNKGDWEREWCIKEPLVSKAGKPVTTPSGFPLWKIVGERIPGEFVKTLPCYVFIRTPLGDVPKPEVVTVDLAPDQLRQYTEMQEQSLTWLKNEKGLLEPLIADLPLTQRLRLRTAALGGMTIVPGLLDDDPDSITFLPGCQSATLNEAYRVLHRPSWEGKKALILTHSKQFAIEAARRIGQKYTVALKTGDTPSKQWDDMKARFMLPVSETDSIQYLVAVISAVGTATDGLQANCAKVLWLSQDDNNINNIQGANRIWRDGVDLDEYEAVEIQARNTIAQDVGKKNDEHRSGVLASVKGGA